LPSNARSSFWRNTGERSRRPQSSRSSATITIPLRSRRRTVAACDIAVFARTCRRSSSASAEKQATAAVAGVGDAAASLSAGVTTSRSRASRAVSARWSPTHTSTAATIVPSSRSRLRTRLSPIAWCSPW